MDTTIMPTIGANTDPITSIPRLVVGSGETRIVVSGATALGFRRRNEDNFAVQELPGGGLLCVVADGMGGHDRGDEASRTACEAFCRAYADLDGGDIATRLRAALSAADKAVIDIAGIYAGNPGSTLTAMVIAHASNREVWLAHVGDCEAYVLGEHEGFVQVARSHALYPGAHQLISALGGHYRETQGLVCQVQKLEVPAKSILALVTDGVVRALGDKGTANAVRVATAAGDQADPALALAQAAMAAEASDNATAVVVQL